MTNQRIISGITSTGKLTLGNYLGAIVNFVELQADNELYLFVANLHGITIPVVSKEQLSENIRNIAAWYYGCGIDPSKAAIFVQSDILEHAQLGYILMCHTYLGELERMTQFKDKSSKSLQANRTLSIPTGLLIYPTLMAADILLYDATYVPVGQDQTQHLELTRTLATRLNEKYQSLLFTIPQALINEKTKKIMSLQEPLKKMSKSDDNINNVIFLEDTPEVVTSKIKKAMTDSDNKVAYDVANKPAISNLMTIYSAIKKISLEACEKEFEAKNYGEFKNALIIVINDLLATIQKKYYSYLKDDTKLNDLLAQGAGKARGLASQKLQIVQNAIGINYITRKE